METTSICDVKLARTVSVLVVLYALLIVVYLGGLVVASSIPFDTDEADHANAAYELYQAAKAGSGIAIFEALVRQSFYPPLHSVAVAISYSLFGASIWSSRFPSVLFFAVHLYLLFLLTYRYCRRIFPEDCTSKALIGSAFTLFYASVSSIVILNSALCMLEAIGLLLVSVLLYLLQRCASGGPFVLASVSSLIVLLIVLTKYSFGLLAAPALVAAIALSYAEFGGLKKSLTAAVLCLGIVAIGTLCWLFLTDEQSAWQFIVGHPSYASFWSAKNLLFYPRAWISSYYLSPAFGLLAFILVFVASISHWKVQSVRFSVLFIVFSFLILTISTTNEQRHMLVTAPAVWFLVGLGGVEVLGWFSRIMHQSKLFINVLVLLVFGSGLWCGLYKLQVLSGELTVTFEGKSEFSVLQDKLVERALLNEPVLVIGAFDQFGIEALRWKVAVSSKKPYSRVLVDGYPFSKETMRRAKNRRRNLAYPWRNDSFPKRPLAAIIPEGYYKSIVLISPESISTGRRKLIQKASKVLKKYPVEKLKAGNERVFVYYVADS